MESKQWIGERTCNPGLIGDSAMSMSKVRSWTLKEFWIFANRQTKSWEDTTNECFNAFYLLFDLMLFFYEFCIFQYLLWRVDLYCVIVVYIKKNISLKRDFICLCYNVYVYEREAESVYVCVSERERERERAKHTSEHYVALSCIQNSKAMKFTKCF